MCSVLNRTLGFGRGDAAGRRPAGCRCAAGRRRGIRFSNIPLCLACKVPRAFWLSGFGRRAGGSSPGGHDRPDDGHPFLSQGAGSFLSVPAPACASTAQSFSAVRLTLRSKEIPSSSLVPIEDLEEGGHSLSAGLEGDPEWAVLAEDEKGRLRERFARFLSPLELDVLLLYLGGCSYEEIAERLDSLLPKPLTTPFREYGANSNEIVDAQPFG